MNEILVEQWRLQGIAAASWFLFVCMATVGYGDKVDF
jgi:hypothetical protein